MKIYKIVAGSVIGIMFGVIGGLLICVLIRVNKTGDWPQRVNTVAVQQLPGDICTDDIYQRLEYEINENWETEGAGKIEAAEETVGTDMIVEADKAKEDEKNYKEFVNGIKLYDEAFDLQNKFLRFHVKANSNCKEDIELKYKVRDAALEYIKGCLKEPKSKENAMYILKNNTEQIKKAAENCIREEGYDYAVQVELRNQFFPIRQYGDLYLPAGQYDALIINIGKARGENFWCMLYPAICYTTDCGAVVDTEAKKEIKRLLTKEEYEEVFINTDARSKGRVRIGFKLLSLFK